MNAKNLRERFRGCLLGAAIGDIAGAAVEAESATYIAKTFPTVDEILSTKSISEFNAADWQVGHYTDDTQMMLCVAEWLLEDKLHSPEGLLARFASAYEPWRRYGSGTESILKLFRHYPSQWRELSTSQFPHGSHGNGSAMRVAPVGLAYFNDPQSARKMAIESSRPTHSHPLAYQGATLQCLAVATATAMTEFAAELFLARLRDGLRYFSDLMQSTARFEDALNMIERGLRQNASCREMSQELGTGVTAHESVPMAIYCFLRYPHSYVHVIHNAIFIGGDTDTIASMAGAVSGAFLGKDAIPSHWIASVREEPDLPARLENLADQLFARYGRESESPFPA